MGQKDRLPKLNRVEKYLYTQKISSTFKTLSVLSILAWLSVMYGFYLTYKHDLPILLTFGLFYIYVAIYLSVSSAINFLYKKFDVQKHKNFINKHWKKLSKLPTIDIFLPICGEDIRILKNTWGGVKELSDNYAGIVRVYVLDDKGKLENKILAKDFEFNYLSRPNKGETKKAGNLKYGFQNTKGEFIIIFDADFRPHKDFIHELLPYMSNKKVGIVQSPQYFDANTDIHKKSPLQYGAANIQEYFYKIIQRSRGVVDGSICVGTNAIYRRAALASIGGTAQKEHSEDVWTGYKLISKGWKVVYIPLILAKGVCPDNPNNFFQQQIRWCAGSMSLMTSKDFWLSKIPLKTKIPYISGFLYYTSKPLILLFPFLNIYLLLYPSQDYVWAGLYFYPSIIVSIFFMYFYVCPRAKLGTLLAYISATWAYSYMLVSLILGIKEEWLATGSKQKLSNNYKLVTIASTVYSIIYVGLVSLCAYLGNIEFHWKTTLVFFWILATIVIQVTYLVFQWDYFMKNVAFEKNNSTRDNYGRALINKFKFSH